MLCVFLLVADLIRKPRGGGRLALLALGSICWASNAHAQASFDVQHFRPSPHSEAFVSVESGAIAAHPDVRAQLFLQYLYRPIQLESATGRRVLGLVDHRFDMTLLASVGLWERISFGLSVPATLYQGGQIANASTGAASQLQTLAFGDLRLEPKVGILRQEKHYLDLAITAFVTLPTSSRGSFSGDRSVSFGGELDLSRRFGPVRIGANGGFQWRDKISFFNLQIGPEIYYRFGLGFDFAYYFPKAKVELMAELFGRTSAERPYQQAVLSPLEWVLAARWKFLKGFDLTVGGGRGILPGYGSPAARVFLALGINPFEWFRKEGVEDLDRDKDGIPNDTDKCVNDQEDKDGFEDQDGCPDPDNDKDGLLDAQDKCPDKAEDKDGVDDEDGCPDGDNDKDGIDDALDKCVNEPEDKDGFEDQDGCPDPDNDKDGVLDAADKCPDKIEDRDGVEDDDGCPEDNDKDGIADDKDKCPNEPETINGVDDFDGCPDKGETLVVMTSGRIDILQKVQFTTGKSELSAQSFNLLNQVAAVLRNHSELNKIRVEGHTDSQGKRESNIKLSQSRAEAVKAYLIAQGIDAARLDARGFGPDKPIAANSTAKGREINRRVAFTIVTDDAGPALEAVPSVKGASEVPLELPLEPVKPVPAQPKAKPKKAPKKSDNNEMTF